ncbi:MAG: Chromate resistance protein ChrB [Candidatus Nitrosopolaris sp.]
MTIKKPESWLVVLYDVPAEPSKFKVRLWRDFKRMGAIYPQMSICIIPDDKENRKNLERIENSIKKDGKLMKIHGRATENDQNRILHIFRVERDKQYDEILEECHEYIDDINLNIKNKKTTQEEVEEMEEALDGLKRWFARIKSIDWVSRPASAIRVEKLLAECQELLHNFTELSHPKKSNRSHPISESVRS